MFQPLLALALASAGLDCNQTLSTEVKLPSTNIRSNVDGVLTLEENGGELEYWDGARWVDLSMPTIRLGIRLIHAEANANIKVRPTRAARAPIRASLHCSDNPENTWFFEAQKISDINNMGTPGDDIVDHVIALTHRAPTVRAQAYAEHLKAVTFYSANRIEIAEKTFVNAAKKWSDLLNPVFQGAALLSAAHLADRRSDFTRAKVLSDQALKLFSGGKHRYFELRAEEFSCRRMNATANFYEHIDCLENLRSEYLSIGEKAETISLAIDISHALRNLGKRPHIGAMLAEVEGLPNDPNLALLRGRYFLLAADSAIDAGLLVEALGNFERAFKAFSLATKDAERWQVNTLIKESNLLQRLGLHQQAFANLSHALEVVSAKAAASRVAAVLVALAGTYQSSDRTDEAEIWYAKAEEIQRLLALKVDYNYTAFLRIESAFGQRRPQVLLEELNLLTELPEKWAQRKMILMNRLQIAVGAKAAAIASLKSIFRTSVSNIDQAYLVVAQAEAAEFQTPIQFAVRILDGYLIDLSQTSDQSPTASLAYLTLRSGEKVRRAWIDSLTESTEPAAVFKTALLATPARFMTSVVSPQKQVEIVAKQTAGEQGFLAQLTGPQEKPPERFKAALVPTLAQFQASLPEGVQALLLLPGDKQSAALWLSQEGSKLVILPAREAILAASLRLNQALASPQSAPKAAEAAAAGLSGLLFAGAPGGAPKQLWILADELSAAIPFSALPWPGSSVPLVQSTDISLMTGVRVDPASQAPQAVFGKPTFFAPAYTAAGAGALQSLEFPGVERARVERESGKTWETMIGPNATRAAFQDLIQTPGAWLHVAAHGKADPGVLGNAGLWLANSEGPDADFLSWLELGNIRNQAELMVLNACQSATGAQPSRQANVSFALAMSTSGANHVVAALWPVSDVASGTWIPAFYKHLRQTNAEQSAFALRQAQLSLYHSPHYRHPFYWASLVHFRRVVF